MNVRPGRPAGHADLADNLAFFDVLSDFEEGRLIHVAVIGLIAVIVVNDLIVAVNQAVAGF